MPSRINKAKDQDIITYQSNDGQISFGVNVFEETVWLTQKQMAELFDKDRKTVTEHINNVYKENELEKDSTSWKFQLVQKEGNREVVRDVEHYNLDVIISVGYRVKSQRGTQFRRWATNILKQYLLNGYAINEQRIRALEKKIDSLPSEIKEEILSEIEKKFDIKINEINKSLLKIANRPITINNQISLASHNLEGKIIELLDKIIKSLSEQEIKAKVTEVKEEIIKPSKDQQGKNKIIHFFKEVGDHNSNMYKVIKGAGASEKIIKELIKLGIKLKDFIS